MSRALHPLESSIAAPRRATWPRWRASRWALLAVLASVPIWTSSCIDDPAVAPAARMVGLALRAQVIGGRTVAIDVFYRRDGGELMPLGSAPRQITVQPGTVQQRVSVDIAPCLADTRRAQVSSRRNACPLVVIVRLLDGSSGELDRRQIEPEAPVAGETVELAAVTLSEPTIVLTPASLEFEATQGGLLPDAQQASITNGGGGSLGALTVDVEGAAAEWLDASLGTDGVTVRVRPSTTALEPGRHEGQVLVHASGAGNSPQAIAVAFDVTAAPLVQMHLVAAGGGSGTVTSEPAGIDCAIAQGVASGICTAEFPQGTDVTLTATPLSEDVFGGWDGACNGGEPTCVVTAGEATQIAAAFEPPPRTLTVALDGTGGGTVLSEPAGISCTIADGTTSGTCTAEFAHGTEVTLTATAATGSDFHGWSGECAGTGVCTVNLAEARAVVATFLQSGQELVEVRITPEGTGSGRVTSEPAGIDCVITSGDAAGTCVAHFVAGTELTVTAVPAAGSAFDGWITCGGANPCTVTVAQPAGGHLELLARFELTDVELTHFVLEVTGSNDGFGRIESQAGLTPAIDCVVIRHTTRGQCEATYPLGARVELTASVKDRSGSSFDGWAGACSGTEQPCVVQPLTAGHITVNASFDFDVCSLAAIEKVLEKLREHERGPWKRLCRKAP